jgi:hypothetical protein
MARFLPPLRRFLPIEHGSWFVFGFSVVLGLLLRPSLAGLGLSLAALSLFLGRTVLWRHIHGPSDPAQIRALLLLGSIAAALGISTFFISDPIFLLPLTCVTPLALFALRADLGRTARTLTVELAAQATFSGLTAALVVAGGGTLPEAGRTWLFATLLGGANLAHVRHSLGCAHHLDPQELRRRMAPVHLLHALLAGLSMVLLATRGLAGILWTTWSLLLYLRALLPYRPMAARTLGWREGGLSVIGLVLLWRALAAP